MSEPHVSLPLLKPSSLNPDHSQIVYRIHLDFGLPDVLRKCPRSRAWSKWNLHHFATAICELPGATFTFYLIFASRFKLEIPAVPIFFVQVAVCTFVIGEAFSICIPSKVFARAYGNVTQQDRFGQVIRCPSPSFRNLFKT